jgi:hypothetical protein
MLNRIVLLFVLMSVSPAFGQQPRARALPPIDWKCFQSYNVGVSPKSSELGLDGDNLQLPRYLLKSIEGRTLKVVVDPERAEHRREFGKSLYDLFYDFLGKNPVYSWRDDAAGKIEVFTFNVDDKNLSVLSISTSQALLIHQLLVLKCR